MRYYVLVALALSACVKPQGEWQVTSGADFRIENLDHVKKGVTTAGELIQELGVPFVSREGQFIFAVRKHRPVERSYLVYASPATQELTVQAKVWLEEGVVSGLNVESYEKLYP
jgi:hypothetical protein